MKIRFITFCWMLYVICFDIYHLLKYSLIFNSKTKDKMQAHIMLTMHALEKGMSFCEKKNNWGGSKALFLCTQVKKYLRKYPIDERVSVAINILDSYKKDVYGDKNPQIIESIEELSQKYRANIRANIGGVKSISMPSFQINYNKIFEFYETRSSVRDFSKEPLSKEEIENVYRIVQTTPTACNRQACHLYTFQNKDVICELIENQLGDQGWCNKADTLFIVTVNQSYFNATYERFEPYIDGGMYAMNVIMALHAQKIASCCKMFIHYPTLEKRVKVIAGISNCERCVMFILAGHYKEEITKSPLSHKLLINSTCLSI
jgi:nitroreductase